METVKNLNYSGRTGRACATTPKQDQQNVLLADQQTFVTSRDIMSEDQPENASTVLERSESKRQFDLYQSYYSPKTSNESFKIGKRPQSYGLEPNDLL